MNNNHKQNQNPTHEQTKTQNKKKPIKINLISFCHKMKMKTLKQRCLHLTSQLNNDVATYGVGIFVAHIGHLTKFMTYIITKHIHDLSKKNLSYL
jgi:hypothetical protein